MPDLEPKANPNDERRNTPPARGSPKPDPHPANSINSQHVFDLIFHSQITLTAALYLKASCQPDHLLVAQVKVGPHFCHVPNQPQMTISTSYQRQKCQFNQDLVETKRFLTFISAQPVRIKLFVSLIGVIFSG